MGQRATLNNLSFSARGARAGAAARCFAVVLSPNASWIIKARQMVRNQEQQ